VEQTLSSSGNIDAFGEAGGVCVPWIFNERVPFCLAHSNLLIPLLPFLMKSNRTEPFKVESNHSSAEVHGNPELEDEVAHELILISQGAPGSAVADHYILRHAFWI
jgi:hypothetical protein